MPKSPTPSPLAKKIIAACGVVLIALGFANWFLPGIELSQGAISSLAIIAFGVLFILEADR